MATTTRARAGSTTHGSVGGGGGSSSASHGLGISNLGSSSSTSSLLSHPLQAQPQQLQRKESVFGQGQAHNDGRRSIVALQQHGQHRRSTAAAMRPLLGGRHSSAGLGQLREDAYGEDGEGAVDESRLDAEEVMRALSVGEARRVEARLRSVPPSLHLFPARDGREAWAARCNALRS
jgi:hypothetical protein